MTIDCELKRKRGMNDNITQRIYTVFIPVANKTKPGELKLDRALPLLIDETSRLMKCSFGVLRRAQDEWSEASYSTAG